MVCIFGATHLFFSPDYVDSHAAGPLFTPYIAKRESVSLRMVQQLILHIMFRLPSLMNLALNLYMYYLFYLHLCVH